MINKIKVSIICSVYNREKYIRQCVDSILKQSLRDIELILIDNGCNDNCPKIIDEYAQIDSRVVPVHNKQGTTYAFALNQGVQMAKGDYIAIVESDDFLSHDLYEKMYNKIVNNCADICICPFIRILNNNEHQIDSRVIHDIDISKNFSIINNRKMLYLHPSIWSKLYSSKIIKKIKFIKDDRYCDDPFFIDLCSSAKNITAIDDSYYYYNQNNPEASSQYPINSDTVKYAQTALNVLDKAIKNGLYNNFADEIIYHMTYVAFAFYERMSSKNKKIFVNRLYKFYSKANKISKLNYKYMNENQIKFITRILQKKYEYIDANEYFTKKIIGIPFYEQITYKDRIKYKILGITYKQKNKINDIAITKYLFGLIKKCQTNMYKKIYFCNALILNDIDYNKMFHHINISNSIITRDCLSRALTTYSLHQKIFPKYKGINTNKDIIICATGPSFKDYTAIQDGVYVGVNKAYKNKNVKLDYMFCSDYRVLKDNEFDFLNYRRRNCQKFFGYALQNYSEYHIPSKLLQNNKIEEYYFDDIITIMNTRQEYFYYDISVNPLPCFGSITFAALAFALWTNPKRIFLVGCDATFDGHFDGSTMLSQDNDWTNFYYDVNTEGWSKFKKFVELYYPNTKIISINPVRLKGMFTDVYTEQYLLNHPEIDRSNISVIS